MTASVHLPIPVSLSDVMFGTFSFPSPRNGSSVELPPPNG